MKKILDLQAPMELASSSDTRKFVAQCMDCQLVKYEPAKPKGLL